MCDARTFAAHGPGWAYHFSNGATFGVTFAARYAGASEAFGASRGGNCKPILWAVLMAVGIEICPLHSPYARFFGIPMTPRFIVVTLAAHLVFGIGPGACFAFHARRRRLSPAVPAAAHE
ncbi:MAG: hypothetical protein HRF50_12465 [Phycisphaerae bacterium]